MGGKQYAMSPIDQIELKTFNVNISEVNDIKPLIRRKRGWFGKALRFIGNLVKCVATIFISCSFGDRRNSGMEHIFCTHIAVKFV